MNKVSNLSDLKDPLQKLYPKLKEKYGVKKLGIFGSYVRNEQREDSDLDILVAFEEVPGLFQYIELENLISDSLGIKVDLVMEDALKPTIKERILHEVLLI
jgi:predicted nucleotidyltransferase